MQTSLMALALAVFFGFFFLTGLWLLNLIYGAVSEIYFRPKIKFLKSAYGQEGLAFAFIFNGSQKVFYDCIKLKLLNPRTQPYQLEIYKNFHGAASDFTFDLNIGIQMQSLLMAARNQDSWFEIQVFSSRDHIAFIQSFKGIELVKLLGLADLSLEEFNDLDQMAAKANSPV